MEVIENKTQEITFCDPGEAAIKKYYPQTFTPVSFQKEQVKGNGQYLRN
jgi:hypothetical protein